MRLPGLGPVIVPGNVRCFVRPFTDEFLDIAKAHACDDDLIIISATVAESHLKIAHVFTSLLVAEYGNICRSVIPDKILRTDFVKLDIYHEPRC